MHYMVMCTDREMSSITMAVHANSREAAIEKAIEKARTAARDFADRTADVVIDVVEIEPR